MIDSGGVMKFHIQTWGCQMNDHDGEKLSGLLSADGFEEVGSAEEAELVLLNTCSIREKAVHKVYSELGRLREEKHRRPLLVGVTGCLAQQEQAALFKRAPHIDFVLGTRPRFMTAGSRYWETGVNGLFLRTIFDRAFFNHERADLRESLILRHNRDVVGI